VTFLVAGDVVVVDRSEVVLEIRRQRVLVDETLVVNSYAAISLLQCSWVVSYR